VSRSRGRFDLLSCIATVAGADARTGDDSVASPALMVRTP